MPRALLVNPWIHDFAAYDFWARPVGLLELGSALRGAGYEVRLVDCLTRTSEGEDRTSDVGRRTLDGSGKFESRVIETPGPARKLIPRYFKRYGIGVEEFKRRLAAGPRPEVVLAASVMTYWWTGVRETIAVVREVFPGVPVVLGGVYASLMPEHAREHSGADEVAAGDWAEGLPPVLGRLGLPAPAPGDFFPAWDLYARVPAGAIITSRGCPFRCPYCAAHGLHPRVMRREPEVVAEELTRLARDYGVGDAAIFDDAIRAGGDEHFIAVLEAVVRRGAPMRLHAINALHLRGLSAELAGLMRRARLMTLRFGLETADADRAAALGDKADLDDLHQAAAHLTAAGYRGREIGVYLLAGLPGQRPAEIESSIRAVLAAGARAYVSEYAPTPGSPLWAEACAASRLDLNEPLLHNNLLRACAHPELTEAEVWRLKALARGDLKK
jgi:radical SAM superfamily enzyme YgiQ (UPF0313 family)